MPVLNILDIATTTEVDGLTGTDEHVCGGYDIRDRVFPWVVPGDPDRDRDVVGRLAVGDGEGAVKAEQKLGPSVVVS